jgi:hypothetical protein
MGIVAASRLELHNSNGKDMGDHMKLSKVLIIGLMGSILITTVSIAGDFAWMNDFSIKAEADSSEFKARLGARFKIGNTEIHAVLSNVDNSADAYMVLRLGEMAGIPTDEVVKKYKSRKGKGWGALAKSLGIKPGSQEFHALKNGDDLYGKERKVKIKGKDKGKGKKKK